MTVLGLTFLAPWALAALVALPLIWWLLRLTPPRPKEELFPPTRLLLQLVKREETPAKSPWWLTLLRIVMAALVILALAQPVQNALQQSGVNDGPLLIVVDNSWAAGKNWQQRRETALSLASAAEQAGEGVVLALTADADASPLQLESASEARAKLAAMRPEPVMADYAALEGRLAALPDGEFRIAWLATGLAVDGASTFLERLDALSGSRDLTVYLPGQTNTAVMTGVENGAEALTVSLAALGSTDNLTLVASDLQGRPLGRATVETENGQSFSRFELPIDLRNEIARIRIDGRSDAGAVRLLDESHGRRRVGLISSANADRADQPLLAPLYYISRALTPFTEVLEPDLQTLSENIERLIDDRASMIVMADIGTLPDEAVEALNSWIDDGGVLVRFAGSRLAAAQSDPFTPVMLRRGGRNLGGTLSWETQQAVTTFNETGAFAGLEVPDDITVQRQVLAEPDIDLLARTWAQLADGTPLVTATTRGRGTLVLFHVTADTSWSNLPLSGAFVDMLRRIVAITPRSSGGSGLTADAVLPPWLVLDGEGRLAPPASDVEPLTQIGAATGASIANPPGLYGAAEGFVARNLFSASDRLEAFDVATLPGKAIVSDYVGEPPTLWRPALLIAAMVLFFIDCLVVLVSSGALRTLLPRAATMAVAGLGLYAALAAHPAKTHAQEGAELNYEASLQTRLAYVVTGDAALDTLSRKGLTGLTRFIASRTALEPGEPVGVDISADELAFYPLLYWPISTNVSVPDAATMQRIDAFMKRGGSVLFDTRDQLSGGLGGGSASEATMRLREILASLDVPALEPVPERHVLTRAFYLLDIFPGRYLDGPLWVEATTGETQEDRPTQRGDGVSSIMITGNDFAGAWAIEADGEPSLPIVPPNATQRVYAYRTGVNIVMYMLTGNYKSDQVHVPALLERLGQ